MMNEEEIKNQRDFSILFPRRHAWTRIGTWEMWVAKQDGRVFIWHHVTQADGGYGNEVRVELPEAWFAEHDVKKLFDAICDMEMLPGPEAYPQEMRENELRDFREVLAGLGVAVR